MTARLSNAGRSASCNGTVDTLDGGSIQIRTGAQPTNVDDAAGGDLLGTLTFGTPAFGAASNGVATANAITSDTNADDSGTAGHARILTSGAAIIADASCGQGTGDFNFDNNVIVAGGTIAVSSMTWTQAI